MKSQDMNSEDFAWICGTLVVTGIRNITQAKWTGHWGKQTRAQLLRPSEHRRSWCLVQRHDLSTQERTGQSEQGSYTGAFVKTQEIVSSALLPTLSLYPLPPRASSKGQQSAELIMLRRVSEL